MIFSFFNLIPRVRVNYSIFDLLISLFISNKKNQYKSELSKIISQKFSTSNIILTPSGRGSLYYLLKASDIERVIIPAYTCKAVAEAIILAGKKYICVDVDNETFNLSLNELKKIELHYNDALLATHQFGFPCDINEIMNYCDDMQYLKDLNK